MYEYEVHEISDPHRRTKNIRSYLHGGKFTDSEEALARLNEMRETYRKYGREFRLMERQVSEWREAEVSKKSNKYETVLTNAFTEPWAVRYANTPARKIVKRFWAKGEAERYAKELNSKEKGQ